MIDRPRHRTGVVIFAAAFAVRAVYLLIVEQPPVQFDARQYASVAIAAPLAFSHPSLWTDSAARAQVSFHLIYQDIIDDEKISWRPYDPPTFDQAIDWLFYSGPVYPGFLALVFNLAPGHDFWIVRFLQAALDSLTAVLIWLVMRRLVSRSGGVLAVAVWIVYGPAIFKVGELLTETLSIFLTVSVVWMMLRAYDTRRLIWLGAAGAVCALLALTKAATVLLVFPMLAAWVIIHRREWKFALRGCVVCGGAWILILTPWALLVDYRYGQISLRDPSYADANLRQANILETEGYNTDAAPFDFWTYPIWRQVRNQPFEYARLYLQKLRRLWWRACDDYSIGFPFGRSGTQWLHKLLVLFAAAGVFVWTRRAGPAAWIAMAVIAYIAGVHTVLHVVSRYNLLAMPFVIGAAVGGILWLADPDRPGIVPRALALAVIPLAAIALVAAVRPPLWLYLPGISVKTAVGLYWVTACIIIVAATWLTFSIRRDSAHSTAGVYAVSALLALLFLGWGTTREAYAEWSVALTDPGTRVSRRITLPPNLKPGHILAGEILIDCVVPRGGEFNTIVRIDHVESEYTVDSLVDDLHFYRKPNYRVFMAVNDDKPANIRCWAGVVLPKFVLDSALADGTVDISVALAANPAPNGNLVVYGDLPQEDSGIFVGPGLFMTSIERYYEGTDPRIWENLTVEPSQAVSQYIDGDTADSNDLSDCLGRQIGQYRILLRLLHADERSLYF